VGRPAAVLPLIAGLLVAACSAIQLPQGVEVPLGAGTAGDTAWTAVAYESTQDGACVEVRWQGAGGQAMCRGRNGGPIGANVVTMPGGGGSVVIVELLNGAMVKGSITFALRPGIPVDIVEAGSIGRFAITAVDGADTPLQLVLRDAAGTSIETHGLR
jgi:hypothetical protein